MKKVLVIDYGAGNLKSISKALQVLGLEVEISCSGKQTRGMWSAKDLLVLPGVGEFGSAMKLIRERGIDEFVNLHIKLSKPLLAICLGMQLLFSKSEENINVAGLKLLDGEVVKFRSAQANLRRNLSGSLRQPLWVHSATLPVPHMCWNKVKFVNITDEKKILLKGLRNEELFYFVHSYYPVCKEKEIVFGLTDYVHKFASMIVKNNIVATQFHLEKSGKSGLKLLKNIIEYFRRI